MVTVLLIFLVALFILGYIQIPYFPIRDVSLFVAFGKTITLYDIFLFSLILWVIGLLPWPFRGIATVIMGLWLLSFFGIIAITGFSNILVFALIVGVIVYIFQGFKK